MAPEKNFAEAAKYFRLSADERNSCGGARYAWALARCEGVAPEDSKVVVLFGR
jgi:hypothetical protein